MVGPGLAQRGSFAAAVIIVRPQQMPRLTGAAGMTQMLSALGIA